MLYVALGSGLRLRACWAVICHLSHILFLYCLFCFKDEFEMIENLESSLGKLKPSLNIEGVTTSNGLSQIT